MVVNQGIVAVAIGVRLETPFTPVLLILAKHPGKGQSVAEWD